jgi:hypothetical protein
LQTEKGITGTGETKKQNRWVNDHPIILQQHIQSITIFYPGCIISKLENW